MRGTTVDFWDLTKLLVRRWLIVLPMLALSAALAVLTVNKVQPDYVAIAYVQLVPPVFEQTKPGQATPDQRNPWLSLGLQTIGNAAIVTVTDTSVIEELKASGYSDSYTLTMGQTSPLITFQVVGTTAQQAQQTAEQLVDRFSKSVATLQRAYGVSPGDSISARRLDLGTNVKMSTSKVKRAGIAVAGAGLLLTAGSTVGLDAWLRRRRRRREERAAIPMPVLPESAGFSPTTRAAGVVISRTNGDSQVEPNPPSVGFKAADGSAAAAANGKEGDLADQTMPISSDATVVLPRLPEKARWPEKTRWLGRSGDKKKHL
jgi:hypothetical protein